MSILDGKMAQFHDATPVLAGRRYASLFLSDMHLGARSCRADVLLSFLQAHEAARIYLVGDIFDTWHGLVGNWTPAQHAVLNLLLARAQAGVELIYTPGNHDALFRKYIGAQLGTIRVADHVIHEARDGRRYLVIHGDSCDRLCARFPVFTRLAAKLENGFRGLGNAAQRLLTRFDLPVLALVDRTVARVNDLIRAHDDFQGRLIDLARAQGADGIICGHFHQVALTTQDGIVYANCGDWVENASAIAETKGGELVTLDWSAAAEPACAPAQPASALAQGV
ncbi:MAG: UDP-2,3-diacylglucosamine diphosphatase [Cypionkella sp.]